MIHVETLKVRGFFTLAQALEDNYEAICPCHRFKIGSVEIYTHCWRVDCGLCQFSGIHVWDCTGKTPSKELEALAQEILDQIIVLWPNTDWEIQTGVGLGISPEEEN